jgi:sirohydrochlorin ferrochelatase
MQSRCLTGVGEPPMVNGMRLPRPALVIAAHGSKSPAWRKAVEAFALEVRGTHGVMDTFASVQPAFLENGSPSIPDAVRVALSAGCPEVVVIPLFLTVSMHAGEDVPGLLGLPVPNHVRRRLVGEGQTPLVPGLPVRIAQLGDVEDLMFRNIVRRLELPSQEPAREAVVLCAYGSSIHHAAWDTLLHALRMRLMTLGYGYACHAYVGHVVGLSPEPTAQAIISAGRMAGIRRVHVVPLLMAVSALQTSTIAAACRDGGKRGRTPVIYAEDAILPDGDLAAHVALCALRAVGMFPSVRGDDVEA